MFTYRQHRVLIGSVVVITANIAWLAGCSTTPVERFRLWTSDGWSADYESAERRAEASGASRVLYFKGEGFATSDATFNALTSPSIKPRLSNHVRATLVQSHEPDRRYAAQFGVERTPAVILVHPDGTYHALTGLINSDKLAQFIDQATPPGSAPQYNPLVPRGHRYQWSTDLGAAQNQSRQRNKPMIVAYERRLTADARRLGKMLATHEVGLRLAGFVHCRIQLMPTVGKAFISPFGAIRLPALVVVLPDGRHNVLEMPTSSEAIARFVDSSLQGKSVASVLPEPASTAAAQATAPGP